MNVFSVNSVFADVQDDPVLLCIEESTSIVLESNFIINDIDFLIKLYKQIEKEVHQYPMSLDDFEDKVSESDYKNLSNFLDVILSLQDNFLINYILLEDVNREFNKVKYKANRSSIITIPGYCFMKEFGYNLKEENITLMEDKKESLRVLKTTSLELKELYDEFYRIYLLYSYAAELYVTKLKLLHIVK